MTYDTLIFEVRNGVAHITLNRPEAANAMNAGMMQELMHVAIVCDEDPAIRAVLITGNGKMFCAGGDLNHFAEFGDDLAVKLKELTTYLHAAVSRFARMEAPIVMAVNGMAAGAGMSFAASGDLVVAADTAAFVMAYTAAGLAPDGSSTYFLPRLIGLRRTQELMLTNRRLSADEALAWGIVNQVVAEHELTEVTTALAERLASGPTRSYGAVKRLLGATFDNGLETQMELEARAIAEMARTSDAREGVRAFVGKRQATFKGE